MDDSDIGTISPEAAAGLEFTSNIGHPQGSLTYITSKEAFLWAGIAAMLAKGPRLDDIDITSIIYNAVAGVKKDLLNNARYVPQFNTESGQAGPPHTALSYQTMRQYDLAKQVVTAGVQSAT